MLVAYSRSDAHWEAFQASFLLKRAHKRMNRTVIQALIRERLELAVEQAAPHWNDAADFEKGRAQVEEWLREQLNYLGLELGQLSLLGLPKVEPTTPRPDLKPIYQEVWLDSIATSDGFALNLALVMRCWVAPFLAFGVDLVSGLGDRLSHSAQAFFGQLDSETCLGQIAQWQATLEPEREWLGDNYRELAALFTASRDGRYAPDKGVQADACWVTRRELVSGDEAFHPGRRYGFLTPYQLFFMLKDRESMHRHYRAGKG